MVWNECYFGHKLGDKYATFNGNNIAPLKQKKPPFWRYNNAFNQTLFSIFHMNNSNLMSYYNGLSKSNREYINMKVAKEVESARLGYFNYRTNAAYQLYKEGKYRHSIAQYKKLLKDTSLSSSSKDWYFFLLANYKLALNQEAQSREFQLDTIMSYWPKVEGIINS